MRRLLTSYAVPVAAVATGIFGGLLPPPSLTALWIVAVLDALLAGWFLFTSTGGGGQLYTP